VAPIHPTARAFDGAADAYERGRPGYPPDAVAWLAAVLGLGPGTTVVDLAAGTGKLTRLLVPTGSRVIAVEPLAGMRAALAAQVPGVRVVDGTAEDSGLASGLADAVTVAQAFHWFDGPAALAEIHRVLRPAGRLGLLWNRRDLTQDLQRDLDQVIERHRGETPSHAGDRWRQAFDETTLFGPLSVASFAHDQQLDADGVVARVLSISFNASLPDAERRRVEADLRAIARRHGEPLVLRYRTDCYRCSAR
jgi:SAM-dependent methyltransferase